MQERKAIKVLAEIADDSISRASGLMFRKYLGKNSGMLFVFESEDYHPFWMKNTYIPLDIAFINKSGTIVDIRHMTPLSTRRIIASSPFKYALEMNLEWFKDNGIKIGNTFAREKIVTSQSANNPEIIVTHDFKTAVLAALKNKWNILITYMFRPVKYQHGISVQREGDKPSVNDYNLILDGSVMLESGKPYEYNDSGNGEYIVVPCVGASGAPRCFFIDGIVDFRYFWNGKTFIDPREIQPAGRKKKRLRPDKNKALEGIPSIPF